MWYKQVLTSELESALFYPGAFDIKINVSFFEEKILLWKAGIVLQFKIALRFLHGLCR